MTSLSSAVSAALSGLDEFSEGIGTIGTNIANQDTTGYASRSVEAQTATDGASQAGAGVVDPALVQRVSDAAQASNVYQATAANSAASTRASALAAIDEALTGNGDIEDATSTFFTDLATLASDPTNAAQISTVMSDAEALSGAFNSAATSLGTQSSELTSQVGDQVSQANNLLTQVATINKELAASPNDASLLDQQQAALTKLSSYVSFNTLPLGDSGAVAVMSDGTVLVDQSGAQDIKVTQPEGSATPELTAGAGNEPLTLPSTGGSLGGLLSSLASVSDASQQLDWTAGTVAGLVNQSQAEGLTADGSLGSALFSVTQPTVSAGAANTGSATLAASVTNASALPSNGQGYTLSYTASGWSATVPGTSQSYSLGTTSSLTLNGLSIAVTGSVNIGDTFQVAPEPGAAAAMRVTTTDPSALAVADPYVLTNGAISATGAVTDTNAGSLSEDSDTVTASPATTTIVPGTSFGDTLELQFTSASAYDVVDTTTGTAVSSGTLSGGQTTIAVAYPSGSASSGSYWQVTLTGSAAAGDVATLSPGGLNSGSNAQRMSDLWSTTDTSLPGGSLQGAVETLVGTTGSAASAAATLSTNTATNLTTAQNDLSTVSGVSLDAQATQLSAYQEAYQAAAKVITTAEAMFKSLIDAV